MDRERQREALRLNELWQEFLRTQDDARFFVYLNTFVDYYNNIHTQSNGGEEDTSLQLSNLPDNLLSKISSHLMYHNHKETNVSAMDEGQKKKIITIIKSLSTLARSAHNIALISSLSVVTSIYRLLDLSSLQNGDHILKLLVIEYIHLLERLFDPHSVWASRSHGSSTSAPQSNTNQEFQPAAIDGVVIAFICECFEVPQLDYDLKSKLIDLIGCVISGSERNATLVISEAVLNKLCGALMDNNLEVLTIPTGLRRIIFSCFTLIVQTLHSAYPGMRQVEVCDIVERYLSAIERIHVVDVSSRSTPEFFTPLLDTLKSMVYNQKDVEALKASFNAANFFSRIVNFVSQFQGTATTNSLLILHKAFINCLGSFLSQSKVAKDAFIRTVGYDRLLQVLQAAPPDRSLLLQLVDMAVERVDPANNGNMNNIENPSVVSMLISWVPHITSVTEQVWLSRTVLELATSSDKNRMKCCDIGIVLATLKSVEMTSQNSQFTKTTGILMCLVERLGALSISAVEIKYLVTLLQHKTVYCPGSFTKRILRAFTYMMEEQKTGRALSYFSLPKDGSVIRPPDNRNPGALKEGFTFHTWLCLEKSDQPATRRVIYSFQVVNGGFEAFVTFEGYLHVVITTDDGRFHVVDVTEQVLADGHWHMLDVVHAVKGNSWRVVIYIDGMQVKKSTLPSFRLKDRLSYSIGGPVTGDAAPPTRYDPAGIRVPRRPGNVVAMIGGLWDRITGRGARANSIEEAPTLTTIDAGHQHVQYGRPVGLHGQLSTVCMFKSCLSATNISRMFTNGANHTEVFYDTALRSDLIFQYHPKMCTDRRCIDMSAYATSGAVMDATLVDGHTCLSHSIMDMIRCIGGFHVMIPLLEQVTRESQRDGDQELFEQDASKENSVSGFFQFLGCFIAYSVDNEEHLLSTNSIPTIGALIQKVDSSLIDEFTLMSVQNLLHDCVQPQSPLYNSIIQHILFDFRIWNNSDKWEVRVGHAQCLYNHITQSGSDMFRRNFGVQFILDSISMFYCRRFSTVANDITTVRSALYDIIKFYVRRNISREELQAILMFIHTLQDDTVVLEAIAMLQSLLEMPGDQIYLRLYESDGAIMLYHMLVNPDLYLFSFTAESRRKRVPLAIKHAILKLLISLLCTPKVSEASKRVLRMEDCGLGGLTSLLQPLKPPSDILSLQLMEIVCSQTTDPNYRNMLSVVSLAQCSTPSTKLLLARMVQQVIKDRPSCVVDIVQCKGWQESISCLIKTDLRGSRSNAMPDEPFVLVSVDGNGEESEDAQVSLTQSPSQFSLDSADSISSPTDTLLNEISDTSSSLSGLHVCNEGCVGCTVKTELQSILLDIHCKLLWEGLRGSSQDIWKERLKVLHSISSAKGTVYVHKVAYTRLLIEYLLTECCAVVRDHAPAEANGTENGQHLINVISDFLNNHKKDGESCSKQLLELTLDLLARMTVWHPTTGWSELARVGLNILLIFASNEDTELCAIACSKLNHLIQTDELKSESEIHYIINSIHNTLKSTEHGECHVHILQVLRAILDNHTGMLEVAAFLPHLMSGNRGSGVTLRLGEDTQVLESSDWRNYMENVVKERQNHCLRLLKQVEQEMLNLWNEVEDEYNYDWHRFQRENGESQLLFKSNITTPLNSAVDSELRRYTNRNASLSQSVRLILDQWRSKMRFLTSTRGTWANSADVKPVHWKMSSHENSCRMRIKMVPNDHFDDHMDASRARDTNEPTPLRSDLPDITNLAAPFQASNTDDDDGMFVPGTINAGDGGPVDPNSRPEELLLRVDCELISMMDSVPGRLEITNRSLYFFELNPSMDEIGQDFISPLSSLRHVHHRLHNLQRTALEFFTLTTNFFLNFTREDRRRVLSIIRREKSSDPLFTVFAAQLLANTRVTNKWVRREISNFEYLMQLNTIAGRTYNDWSQYPVFPWVLQDYTSSTLDLSSPDTYRKFWKPAGALKESIETELRQRYEEFDDPGGMVPFHHGTHYSSAAGVVTHFLVRMEPFTTKHIHLQNGRFDVADRLFFSVNESFNSVLTSLHDCKELTPDFFCLPEFLVNVNEFDLGRPQGDVVLPQWVEHFSNTLEGKVRSAEDFIWKHREALESDFVSDNLHEWIDLIFGYKQRGTEAINACNVYPAYSYEGAYDLSQMSDPKTRAVTEKIIKEFGQTPIQLIDRSPHPKRKTQQECLELELREGKPSSILPYLDNLKPYKASVHENAESGNIIVACVPPAQPRPFISPDTDSLVTISDEGYVGLHRWQPVDKHIENKFVFQRDLLVDSRKTNRRVVGPFLPEKKLESKQLAVSVDAEKLYSGGYWDNTLRIYPLNQASGTARIQHIHAHYGVVTCLHLDRTGEHLVTGSADTTCKVWDVSSLNENSKPLQTLYGHDDEVTSVCISTEYDMVVSGSKDGTVNIHTVRKGLFMQSLPLPRNTVGSHLVVKEIGLSSLGNIIVYTEESSANSSQPVHSLLRYSINGYYLDRLNLGKQTISTSLVTAQDYLIYGTADGHVYVREIHRFTRVNRLSMGKPVRCISIAYNFMTRKHSHILVGLEASPSMLIVLARNAEPRVK